MLPSGEGAIQRIQAKLTHLAHSLVAFPINMVYTFITQSFSNQCLHSCIMFAWRFTISSNSFIHLYTVKESVSTMILLVPLTQANLRPWRRAHDYASSTALHPSFNVKPSSHSPNSFLMVSPALAVPEPLSVADLTSTSWKDVGVFNAGL